MKAFFIVLCAFACLWIQANANCVSLNQKEEGEKIYKAGEKMIKQSECAEYTCHEDGSWTSLGCGVWQCEDAVGYQNYDYSKPYPECCPHPICKSDLKN
ncbi:Protein of unknown function [Cotesia congregata]|uniref:Single domain-containing protein n=1 Tax=Cotesia congregata TaxID=51543 RepID=A0A8J2HM73_COTCN|nr:Protein of unknown function [Cotesia congregata]